MQCWDAELASEVESHRELQMDWWEDIGRKETIKMNTATDDKHQATNTHQLELELAHP